MHLQQDMEPKSRRHTLMGPEVNLKRNITQPDPRKIIASGYFSVESFLLLCVLAVSLLTLPLILPPLPPPPLLLLLVPIAILAVLLFLALVHNNVQNVKSSCL